MLAMEEEEEKTKRSDFEPGSATEDQLSPRTNDEKSKQADQAQTGPSSSATASSEKKSGEGRTPKPSPGTALQLKNLPVPVYEQPGFSSSATPRQWNPHKIEEGQKIVLELSEEREMRLHSQREFLGEIEKEMKASSRAETPENAPSRYMRSIVTPQLSSRGDRSTGLGVVEQPGPSASQSVLGEDGAKTDEFVSAAQSSVLGGDGGATSSEATFDGPSKVENKTESKSSQSSHLLGADPPVSGNAPVENDFDEELKSFRSDVFVLHTVQEQRLNAEILGAEETYADKDDESGDDTKQDGKNATDQVQVALLGAMENYLGPGAQSVIPQSRSPSRQASNAPSSSVLSETRGAPTYSEGLFSGTSVGKSHDVPTVKVEQAVSPRHEDSSKAASAQQSSAVSESWQALQGDETKSAGVQSSALEKPEKSETLGGQSSHSSAISDAWLAIGSKNGDDEQSQGASKAPSEIAASSRAVSKKDEGGQIFYEL